MDKEGEFMARKARDKQPYGLYYVTQKSSGCRPLFMTNEDRNHFIDILQHTVNTFNCKVYEYCVQNDHTYHLILDVNGSDLSKIMKSINIPYAMYIGCDGPLFGDRYKSQPLENEEALMTIRQKIKSQISLEEGYSSFCISQISPCLTSPIENCTDCISTIDEAYDYLNKTCLSLGLSQQALLKDKVVRNEAIRDFRRHTTLSLKLIGQVFGGLSESTVCKILSQKTP